jgi:hypothetical protein
MELVDELIRDAMFSHLDGLLATSLVGSLTSAAINSFAFAGHSLREASRVRTLI